MAVPVTQSVVRFQRGPLESAAFPAASGQQINVGDLVYLRSGDVCSMSAFALLSGNELQSWSGARSAFLGVSLDQWNSTYVKSGNITVALGGFHHFPYKATSGTTSQPGAFVSFTEDQASGYFHPQRLMICSGQATGIGTVVEQFTSVASGQGELVVNLTSVVVDGTIQIT